MRYIPPVRQFNREFDFFRRRISCSLYYEIFGTDKCVYCNDPLSKQTISIEHVEPRSQGGGGGGNKCLACRTCNNSKGSRSLDDWYPLQPFYRLQRHNLIKEWSEKYKDYLKEDKERRQQHREKAKQLKEEENQLRKEARQVMQEQQRMESNRCCQCWPEMSWYCKKHSMKLLLVGKATILLFGTAVHTRAGALRSGEDEGV